MLRQSRWGVIAGIVASMSLVVVILFTFLQAQVVQAEVNQDILYVAPGGDCGAAAPCFDNVQAAVDAAAGGDEIRIATGTYTQTYGRPTPTGYASSPPVSVITQSVLITKSLDIRGGYTILNWVDSDPIANETILDAQYTGRVFLIFGAITTTIKGLHIVNGDAQDLGGTFGGEDLGGGVFVVSATITLEQNIVRHNHHGGLVIWYGKTANLTDNSIQDNTGSTFIYWNEQATLMRNLFANHLCSSSFPYGGGITVYAYRLTLTQNMFSQNNCLLGQGGGASIAAFQGVVSENSFVGNQAGLGGGVSIGSIEGTAHGESHITVTNNLILDNTAERGGGIFLGSFRGILINNVIINNHILYNHNRASGIGVSASKVTIIHSTIGNNTGGDGSGIFADMTVSYITITNSIISDQVIGIYLNSEYNKATVDSTLWFNNGINTSGSGTFTITNPFQGDPAFMADGYHIGSSSAAIDKGVSTLVTEDIDGTLRPVGVAPDLGADEFPELTEWFYLPVLSFPQ